MIMITYFGNNHDYDYDQIIMIIINFLTLAIIGQKRRTREGRLAIRVRGAS